jgi:hypothetical protein
VQEANDKLERMEYVCKKAERNVDVERRTLEEERLLIQSSLRKNVCKIHRDMQKMTDLRQDKNKVASSVRAVSKRLNFEKEVATRISVIVRASFCI